MATQRKRNWGGMAEGGQDQAQSPGASRYNVGNKAEPELEPGHLLLTDIKPKPGHNPRNQKDVMEGLEGLMATMREHGQLKDIVVRPDPDGPGYLIVAGERRYHSAKKLGWYTIRVNIMDAAKMAPEKSRIVALVENLQSKGMASDDTALAVAAEVSNSSKTKSQIAQMLGKPNSWVTDCLAHAELLTDFPFLRGRSMASSVAYRFKSATARLSHDERKTILQRLLKAPGDSITLQSVEEALNTQQEEPGGNQAPSSSTKSTGITIDFEPLFNYPKWEQLSKAEQRKCKSAYAKYSRAHTRMLEQAETLSNLLPKKYWKKPN